MFRTLDINFKHVPSISLSALLEDDTIEAFADTPVYRPSVFLPLVKGNKFIFIDRDFDSWYDSFKRVGLQHTYNNIMLPTSDVGMNDYTLMDKHTLQEVFGGEKVTDATAKQYFDQHRAAVVNNIPPEQLLVYNFKDGWKTLCEFLNKDIPDENVPHINKNYMFDKI